ncbi:MAG: ABC transporter ATP-binding protein [Actinomycetes bacterium]
MVADVRVRRPGFDVVVDLSARPRETLVLLGPNGAGKSTALRALAGLVPLASGRVALDGDEWASGSHALPTEQRSLGVVFQDYLLFPHLTALENVAFGLRAQGLGRRAARARAGDWLARVGLAEVAGRRPGALSGGQAQRVALARALAPGPRLLLLDEPLAALDAGTRMEIRSELRRHLEEFDGVTVLVTHDPLDAMILGDRLVVMERGQVVQQGTAAEVARAPRTDYVARLVGLNLLRGKGCGREVAVEGGGVLRLASPVADGGQAVLAAVPPSAVTLHRQPPEGSARNHWPGTIAGMEQHGDVMRVRLDAAPSVLVDVTTSAVVELGLVPGMRVWASLKATEIAAYPA